MGEVVRVGAVFKSGSPLSLALFDGFVQADNASQIRLIRTTTDRISRKSERFIADVKTRVRQQR